MAHTIFARNGRTRKGQIKMFETVAILIVFFFLLVFGMSFYFKVQQTSLSREIARASQLQTIQVAQKAALLPELDCSTTGVQVEFCFDMEKAKAFAQLTDDSEKRQAYYDILGESKIVLNASFNDANWTLYDYPRSDATNVRALQIPVLTFEPVSRAYLFSILEVTVYER